MKLIQSIMPKKKKTVSKGSTDAGVEGGEDLKSVFVLKLRSLLDTESELIDALPKMAEAAGDSELKKAFEEHLEQTKEHEERIKKAFEILDISPQKLKGEAIQGLIRDAEWVVENVEGHEARDAAMIAAAQYVEHYEIAGYGSALAWARRLGYEDIAELLTQTLEEEKETDIKLSALAESSINDEALVPESMEE